MRIGTLGLVGVVTLAAGALLLAFVGNRPAHISALVSEDFSFGVFYRSLNDLRAAYEGPHQRQDVDPARLRIGDRINIPGFDGVSYTAPVASVLDRQLREIFLVPITDFGAMDDAYEDARSNILMKSPDRVAKNYAAFSEADVEVERSDDNRLVREAVDTYPISLCGHPKDAATLRLMLRHLLSREAPRLPQRGRLLAREIGRLPNSVGNVIARECDDLVVGILPQGPEAALSIEIRARLRTDGLLRRATPLAERADLARILTSFPYNTMVAAGAVFDGKGWTEVGLPLPVGDGAFAFGIVENRMHPRPYALLLAARPLDDRALARLQAEGPAIVAPGEKLRFETVGDEPAKVHTARLDASPAWLGSLLDSRTRKQPPVYLSTTVEEGIWYCAVGSQAQAIVRHSLGCLRGAPELGLLRSKPVSQHKEMLTGPHLGVALVTANGLKAFGYSMPLVELAALGTPAAATAVLTASAGKAKAALRLSLD